jgi:hypothetical protein
MPNQMEKVIAELLKPKAISGNANEAVERLESFQDTSTVSDSLTSALATPERRVGFARCNYSEVA